MAYKAFEPSSGVLSLYEEGTFTPEIAGSSTAGSATYTTQVGYYTRFNNWVHIAINLVWTATSGQAGTGIITGLPFTSVNNTGHETGLYSRISSYTLATSTQDFIPLIAANSTQIDLKSVTSGGASQNCPLNSSGTITLTGIYEI